MMDQSQSHELAAGLGMMGIAFIVFAVLLVPMIFYLLTLQKALNRCSPECRAMNPGMVWLMLIPLFNVVWQFFIVINLAKCQSDLRAGRPGPSRQSGPAV